MNTQSLHSPRDIPQVMVSSTFTDLKEHRAALLMAINKLDLHPNGMEYDDAKLLGDVIDSSLQMVRDCAAYILITSLKYGQTPECPKRNPDKLSITELEFNEAQRLGRPTLLFIMGEDHDVKSRHVETNRKNKGKLNAFRERAKKAAPDSAVNRVYSVFNSLEEFKEQMNAPLAELARHLTPAVILTDSSASYALTIAEAKRLAAHLESLRLNSSPVRATVLWFGTFITLSPTPIINKSPIRPDIDFPPVRHNFTKAKFCSAFELHAGRHLGTDGMFGNGSAWCDGQIYVTTETENYHLLNQFVRLDGIPEAFPNDALAALLSESDLVFRTEGSPLPWDKASRTYGFGNLFIGPFTHQSHHWWSFLTFISETQGLPIRYKPRKMHGWVYAGGKEWLMGGAVEKPFEWSQPVPLDEMKFRSNEEVELRLDDDPSSRQITFGYLCHWFDVLRACELACNWIAASLQR